MYIHIVKPGETLTEIAKMYNVSPQRIISDNGIYNEDAIVEGQALVILIPDIIYTVKKGDTPDKIANKFGITYMELLQNNPFIIGTDLYEGQEITISFKNDKTRDIHVNAYAYPNINLKIFEYSLPYLTYLTIFGYGFNADGSLIPTDDEQLIALAQKYDTIPVMLLSTIDESGGFSSEKANKLLQNKEIQDVLINNIIEKMHEKGYKGLDIDFEFISPEFTQEYINFVKYVTEKLNQFGYFVNVDLAPKTSPDQQGLLYEAHNYSELGNAADTVLLMTYEWGYTYGPPMAVAPINKVENVVNYAIAEIPVNKIFMGIPGYAYDWELPYTPDNPAITLGNLQALHLAQQTGSIIKYDENAQTPYFQYVSSDGKKHVVWFEDARSIQKKLDLVKEKNLFGVGYWNIMRAFPQNWAVLNNMFRIVKL